LSERLFVKWSVECFFTISRRRRGRVGMGVGEEEGEKRRSSRTSK
jgi:hypothetical protein